MKAIRSFLFVIGLLIFVGLQSSSALTSAFTYQGLLTDGATPAGGTYQMTFKLFDAGTGGTQVGSTITSNSVAVSNGVFTIVLDFGAPALNTNADRWLEIAVKKPADPGFSTLSPRTQLTSSPYSLRTLSASSADSLSPLCIQCVQDSQINSLSGSKVAGPVTSAATANNVTGVVAIGNGGTGSATQNFVDLSTTQAGIGGNKTFTGNVTVNGTLAATLGQTANTVYSTASLTVGSASSFALIPGLTQTITVPAGYKAYISTDGGIQTTATTATGFSLIDVGVLIDGAFTAAGNYQRVYAANTGGVTSMIQYWSFNSIQAIAAGSHTITVQAGGTGTGGSNASVGGSNTSALQAQLTVVLVKN